MTRKVPKRRLAPRIYRRTLILKRAIECAENYMRQHGKSASVWLVRGRVLYGRYHARAWGERKPNGGTLIAHVSTVGKTFMGAHVHE